MMDGLQRAGSTVLEPMLKCEFAVPEEFAGRVASDVSRMRGEVVSTQSGDGIAQLTARVPVPTSMDYSVQLSALTGGKGVMSARFDGYQPCPAGEEHIMPYRGVHPLDTAKYILAARSALEGEVWA